VWEKKDYDSPAVSGDGRFVAVSDGKSVVVLRIFPEK